MKIKNIYLALLLSASLLGSVHAADIMTEDFETDGDGSRYTATQEFYATTNKHWGRTDGVNITNVTDAYSAFVGNTFWAAEDVDSGGNGLPVQTIAFMGIDITDFENLAFSGLFGAGNENEPGASTYDANDEFKIQYRIDGGDYVDGVCFAYESGLDLFNEPIGLDANCDGESDGVLGRLGNALQAFGFNITGTGDSLDLLVTVSIAASGEELAFDNLKLTGDDVNGIDNQPQVSSTLPAEGAIDVLASTDITINFDEPIDASTNAVTVQCGLIDQAFTGLPFSGTSMVLTPTTDLPFGTSCTVDVFAIGVKDQDGTADEMDMDFSFDFTVVVDTKPSVSSTDPVDADVGVAVGSDITINFDEPIDASINAATVKCGLFDQAFIGLPFSGTSMVLTPNVDLPFGTSCTVDVFAAEVKDQDGTADEMDMDFSFDFTVVADVPAVIDIIVNEYQADPDANNGDANGDGSVDTSEDEFIEIYNNGTESVDISGWTVSDAVGVRHIFAPGTKLDGCRAIVIFGGGTPTGDFGGSQTTVASTGFLGLNNGGDSIIINDGMTDQVNVDFGAAGTNQSYTLDPDITGLTFVEHSGATDSGGTFFSPGTKIDGGGFIPCDGTPTPPRVNNSTPINGSGGVALDADITITFSENVNASVNAATLICGGKEVIFAGLPLVDADVLVINPNENLPNGEICTLDLIATGITDLDDVADELDGNGDGTAGDNYTLQFIAGIPEVEIYEIQGTGLVSPFTEPPFTGITVRTLGNIITALDTNGFYMQTSDANDDNEKLTSNGIFVYTDTDPTDPSLSLVVGDQVDLTGEIVEFFGLTEFTKPNDYILNISSSDNALPAAIILDTDFPSTDPTVFPCGDEALGYECFEGMYFEMPGGFISAASVGFFGSDRDDVWVNAGSARAMRESGIDFPGLPDLPVFDGNPELIEMSVDALTLPTQSLAAGSEIALKGVISFGFGDYELQPSELTVLSENVIPSSVRDATIDEFTVASANIQRFFNDDDDDGPEDDGQVENSGVYEARLDKVANYVVNDMKSPTIIGLQEIENSNVLEDLIVAISEAGGPDYEAALSEGNDQGGIDVAYLYQGDLLSNVFITQLGKIEENDLDESLLHDRPPLRLAAEVTVGDVSFPVNVLVVHMRSRSGIDDVLDGARVRDKRLQQANSVAKMVKDILDEQPNTPLYVIGDFNAFQFSDGYVDVVGQITGQAVETENLVWTEPLFVNAPLTQAVQELTDDQQYSYVFRGSAQVLDNALMNDPALMALNEMQFVRGQADANVNFEDDSTTSLRSTDHDGFVLFIKGNDDLIFENGFE